MPSPRVVDFFALGVSASWLVDVMAARGGLEGGDGSPVEGTSGIPLGPCNAGSAVVEPLERGVQRVDEVAAGEDVGLAGSVLAVVITTTVIIIALFHGRHCCWRMPPWLVVLVWCGSVDWAACPVRADNGLVDWERR